MTLVFAESSHHYLDLHSNWSTSTRFTNQGTSPHPYFPDSQTVMDMALLSHAVYKLKDRVSSCNDARARDVTLINNFLREESQSSDKSRLNNYQTNDPTHDLYQLLLPEGTECMYYSHDTYLGTQVLVVRSTRHKYVTVAYAGTDDWRTALMDGNIMLGNVGPSSNITKDRRVISLFDNLPDKRIQVHHGFNEAVFDSKHLLAVLRCVHSARVGGDCNEDVIVTTSSSWEEGNDTNVGMNWWPWHTSPLAPSRGGGGGSSVVPYQLYTTGHSLGAADSVLLGAGLHLMYPNNDIRSINFGCPKIGNTHWSYWIDSLQPDKTKKASKSASSGEREGSYEVFRFVNKIDLVPRLPELGVSMSPMLSHAGHTLQMSVGGIIKAYYDHYGDEDIGYLGVPFGWEAASYALMPMAIASHPCSHYVEYLNDYKPNATFSDPGSLFYVNEFELMDGFVAPPKPVDSESATSYSIQR